MIFVDSGPLLAKFHRRDPYRAAAVEVWREIELHGERWSTSSFVLSELFTLLSRRAGYGFAAGRARSIYRSAALTILRPDEDDEMKALAYFEKFADQGVSFTDAVSFALMRRHRIRRVFTFDRHFALAGFEAVPGSVSAAGWISEGPPAGEEGPDVIAPRPAPGAG